VQEPDFDIDFEHDGTSVSLTVEISKDTDEELVAEILWLVSRGFAEAERVPEEEMHLVLEQCVQGFENVTHLKFVWERSFEGNDPFYPQRLSAGLARQMPSRTIN
jgi:hypothetical protein